MATFAGCRKITLNVGKSYSGYVTGPPGPISSVACAYALSATELTIHGQKLTTVLRGGVTRVSVDQIKIGWSGLIPVPI
jgi:hypothetical protein